MIIYNVRKRQENLTFSCHIISLQPDQTKGAPSYPIAFDDDEEDDDDDDDEPLPEPSTEDVVD